MQTNKIIRVEVGGRLALAKRFKLQPNYVSSMLSFLNNTSTACQVRKAAMKDFGGTLYQSLDYSSAKNKADLIKDDEKVTLYV